MYNDSNEVAVSFDMKNIYEEWVEGVFTWMVNIN